MPDKSEHLGIVVGVDEIRRLDRGGTVGRTQGGDEQYRTDPRSRLPGGGARVVVG